MASQQQVKEYLAYWLQLGKRVVVSNGEKTYNPVPVLQGQHFSPGFEDCWAQIMTMEGQNCYIEGTSVTLAELMSSAWDITDCSRCDMPIGTSLTGCDHSPCPCSDLMHWPNNEVPMPHLPIINQPHLSSLRDRLQRSEAG